MSVRRAIAACLVATLLASALTAQATSPRSTRDAIPAGAPALARTGFWVGAGLGAGAASLHCSICSNDLRSRGTSGYLRVGTTLSPTVLLGAEFNAWLRSDQAGNQRVLSFTGNAYWYPNPRHGYYLKAGLGRSRYRHWTTENRVTDALTSGGFAAQVGAGYEVRVNPRMSIVPYLNLIGSARGSLATERDDGTHLDHDRLSNKAELLVVQLGLGFTWH